MCNKVQILALPGTGWYERVKVIQAESVPYTGQTNGGVATACNISGATNTNLSTTTAGNTTFGSATSSTNLRMNCNSTDTTIRWNHVLNAMFVEGSDGNANIKLFSPR